jgi:hypothetical protein
LPEQIEPEHWPQVRTTIETAVRESHDDVLSRMAAALRETESLLKRPTADA